jgi:pimeloyl-ACP methyl ester carboxylesterase
MNKAKYFLIGIPLVALFLTTSIGSSFNVAHARTSSCYDGVVMPPGPSSSSSHVLPVILVHGYIENAGVWSKWESYLKNNAIPFCTVSFIQSDDTCGRAADHANELNQIVQNVKRVTGQNQVNIVSHSKGGLDARVYLAQSGTQDVANLVMIGTPNGGDPLANNAADLANFFTFYDWTNFFCRPALYDLEVGASDTNAAENLNTNYYTIYGDWNPSLVRNCPAVPNSSGIDWPELEKEGYSNLQTPNDGVVPASSVEALPNYIHHTSFGSTHDCHTNLLSKPEFDVAKDVLKPIG